MLARKTGLLGGRPIGYNTYKSRETPRGGGRPIGWFLVVSGGVRPWNLGTSAAAVPGQTVATSRAKLLNVHYIVHLGGSTTYHDPSYRETCTGATQQDARKDFTTKAVAARESFVNSALHWGKSSSIPQSKVVFANENW